MQIEISQIQEALESTVNEYSKIVQFLNSFISTLRLDDAFHDYVIQQLATDPQPDGSVTVNDMERYGYQFHMHEKMLPLNHNRATLADTGWLNAASICCIKTAARH